MELAENICTATGRRTVRGRFPTAVRERFSDAVRVDRQALSVLEFEATTSLDRFDIVVAVGRRRRRAGADLRVTESQRRFLALLCDLARLRSRCVSARDAGQAAPSPFSATRSLQRAANTAAGDGFTDFLDGSGAGRAPAAHCASCSPHVVGDERFYPRRDTSSRSGSP